MFNPKELRIGNFFNFGSTPAKVIGISEDGIQYEIQTNAKTRGNIIIEGFKPLPLTEKWLLNLGFQKFLETVECNFYENDVLSIDCKNGIAIFYKKQRIWGEKDCHLGRLEYVHQLQNLYFALTGEELEVHLP